MLWFFRLPHIVAPLNFKLAITCSWSTLTERPISCSRHVFANRHVDTVPELYLVYIIRQDPAEASHPAGRVGERHSDHGAGDRDQLPGWHRAYCLSLLGLARRRGGHRSGWASRVCVCTISSCKMLVVNLRTSLVYTIATRRQQRPLQHVCAVIASATRGQLLFLRYWCTWLFMFIFILHITFCTATEALNTCYITSTYSTCSVEEIVAAAPNGYRWFQLYVYRDRKLSEQIVHRVEGLGYKALVLTVDVPYTGKRRDDIRNQFKLPPHLKVKNFDGVFQVKQQGDTETDERWNLTRRRTNTSSCSWKQFTYASLYISIIVRIPLGPISRRLQAQRSMGSQPTPWTPPSAGRTCTGCRPSPVCPLSSRVFWPRRTLSWPWSTASRASSCPTTGGVSWTEAQPQYAAPTWWSPMFVYPPAALQRWTD